MTTVLESICDAAYDVILAAAGVPGSGGLQVAQDIAVLSPATKTILIIDAEDQDAWQQHEVPVIGVQFLLKKTFAYNVLHLLADCD